MALTRNTSLYNDIGDSGLNHDGWGEVGDEFLQEWRGAGEKAKRVREMLYNSPVIGALRLAVEMPIRDIEWDFVSDEGEDDPRLELLNDAWDAMTHSWDDHISDALGFLWYGWSMFTVTYQVDNGRVLWRKLKTLGHDTLQRWLFDEDGGLRGVQQWPHLWPDEIPIERMLIYRFRRARGNPEGESILRPAWPAWYYAKNVQHIEAIGIERNLAGLPTIQLPEGADMTESDDDSTDIGRARRLVRNVRNDEHAGIVLPPGWEFNLVSSGGGNKAADTDMVINRYDKRMLMATLSQFLMLGMDNVGAMATFEGATDFFTLTLNAAADTISRTFTKFAVERLLKLNGYEADGIRLEHSPAGSVRPEMIADALAKISGGGFISWTADDEVWLRSLLRLPERDAEEIEAERETERAERQERAEAMRRQFAGGNTGGNTDEQSADVDAEHFAADGDERFRRRMERQWQDRMAAFLTRQKRDVVKQAKREHA